MAFFLFLRFFHSIRIHICLTHSQGSKSGIYVTDELKGVTLHGKLPTLANMGTNTLGRYPKPNLKLSNTTIE
jgi:hypothetical protein